MGNSFRYPRSVTVWSIFTYFLCNLDIATNDGIEVNFVVDLPNAFQSVKKKSLQSIS